MLNTRSMVLALMIVVGSGFTISPTANALELKASAPEMYIVNRGDTLWDIASIYLNEAWLWPQIWDVNPEIANPHLIYPGDQLRLVMIDGQPRLSLNRAGEKREVNQRLTKLSPKIRKNDKTGAIQAIALNDVSAWFERSRVVDRASLEDAAYIVAGIDGQRLLKSGDEVYSQGVFDQSVSTYGIYELGQTYRDPETRQKLGVEIIQVGTARIVGRDSELTRLMITEASQAVSPGDRLLVTDAQLLDPSFFPKPPAQEISGRVIGLGNERSIAGPNATLVINQGQNDDVVPGTLLEIAKSGVVTSDPRTGRAVQLPNRAVGLALVYQGGNQVSYALILESSSEISVGDIVQSPR